VKQPKSDILGRWSPRDEADPGTPGAGAALGPERAGDARADGRPCPSCGGSGKIIAGIGGA
jgi:hypothetical protein